MAPAAARLRIVGMGALAMGRIPASRSTVVAAYLDDPRLFRVAAGYPVEAVAAQIHDPAAFLEIAIENVEARAGPVFGMRPGHNDSVAVDQCAAPALQILFRAHFVLATDMRHPLA